MGIMGFFSLVMAVTSGTVGATSILKLRGSNAMQPQQAALTLSRVETQWRSQALQFAECKADAGRSDCGTVQGTFRKSCGTVVGAVVSASSGNKETVSEYMAVVCDEPQLRGWQQERCHSFARAVLAAMTADEYENREHLRADGLCASFWADMSSAEAARVIQEKKLQDQRLEAERARRAKLAQAEAERAAAERKRIAEERAAKRHAAEVKREEKEMRWKAEAAARAAEQAKQTAKRAADLTAAKKAAEQVAKKKA